MNKKTTLFILITLIAMLILVTSVNAATDNTNTSTTHSISEKTTTTEPVVKEKIENTQTKQKTDKTQDKTITKTNKTRKNTKTSTKTIEVTDGNSLTNAFEEINNDVENTKYTINLNQGTYNPTGNTIQSTKNIIINGNQQTLDGNPFSGGWRLNCKNLTITNTILNAPFNNGNLTIINSTINGIGNIETTSTLTTINSTITEYFSNNGNLTLINTMIIPTTYENNGIIYIDEDSTLQTNIGQIIQYQPEQPQQNTKTIENENITREIITSTADNYTFINCQINAKITNNGNITLINSTLADSGSIDNNGIVIIADDCIISENFYISPDGEIVVNATLAPLLNVFDGNFTFENMNFRTDKLNKGNLTLINCNITSLNNIGNITLINCSFKDNINGYCRITGEWGYGEAVGAACFTNTGTCTIDNCVFENNYAGLLASAINNYGNMTINNTVFHNNSGSQYGGAIYLASNSNTNILNSNFTENHVINYINNVDLLGGGAIYAKDTYFTIDNCRFKNNYAYNNLTGISGVNVYGAAICSQNSNASITNSYFENNICENGVINNGYEYRLQNGLINITHSTFTKHNEGRNIIYGQREAGHYNLNENQFTDNTNLNYIIEEHEYSAGETIRDTTIENITNNQFTNNKLNTNTINLGYANNTNIRDNTYTNTTLSDQLTLNIPEKIYTGEPVTITGTYTLDPKYYDEDILEQNQFQLYINGVLNQTQDTLEFTITPTSGNMVLIVQPTISQTQKVETIRTTTLTDVIITPENYDSYNYNGLLIGVAKDSKVIFQGEFTDKELSVQTNDIIIDGKQATFTNSIFTLEATGITLQNMKINNTQTQYPIQNTKDNNIITGNTITITNTGGKTAAIYNKANNTQITDNTLYVDGPAGDIDFSGDGVCTTQAILLIGGNQNKIENNNITITSTSSTSSFGTIEGITNSINATNTIIQKNKLNVSGGMFNYAINTQKNIDNITISNNNILVTGERYTNGIQAGNNATNILITNNTIKCICQNTTPLTTEGALTYGIITTKQAGNGSNNITITQNHITLTGTANYGMEIYETTNTIITNNTIILTGTKSMGIGYAHSPNSTITGNTIKTNDDTTTPLNSITEELQPQNVGIKIQQASDNILIQNNTIQTYDKGGEDTCIDVEANNITIKDNNLTSTTQTGDNTIQAQPDTIIENNNAIEQESTTQTTTEDLTLGDNTTLTAQFYDDTYTPLGDGKAIFKVNGKTLRDNQGNVIYAEVINGRAELPDVNITQEWTKEGTTIQAIYIGDNNNDPIITEATTVTVTKPEATITLEAPTTATTGETITLTATITDDDVAINSGRVAFKLNGKTLKDPKTGKALYAEVRDGVATITYTIPEKTKAKEYVLTAVFTDIAYDRVEAESKLNVVKA